MAEILNPGESAGGIILNPEGKIVLVEQHGNSWALPKGMVEEGESLLGAARREIFEETGLKDLEFVKGLGSYTRRSIGAEGKGEHPGWPTRKRTFFLFKTSEVVLNQQADPHHEITQARWVTVDEALVMLTHPKDRGFLESVRAIIEE